MDNIRPEFDLQCNERSFLARGVSAKLIFEGNTYTGSCEVWIELPNTHVHVEALFDGIDEPTFFMLVLRNEDDLIQFELNECKVDGFIISCNKESEDKVKVKWCSNSSTIKYIQQDVLTINSAKFHLFNLDSFLPKYPEAPTDTLDSSLHTLNISNGTWEVNFIPVKKSSDPSSQAPTSEFLLTHLGIVKNKNNVFSNSQLEEELQCLKYLLSFANGQWIEPVCPCGYDEDDRKVWGKWNGPYEQKSKPFSLISNENITDLDELYKKFSEKWNDRNWKKTLRVVIYWYLHSNAKFVNIDAGIILTQSALERLSYEYVVNDKKIISKKGFNDIRASDKLRILFASLNLPTIVPSNLKEIHTLIKVQKNQVLDSAYALTEVRNSIVHPENKYEGHLTDLCYSTWKLGQWYLGLSILAVIGYEGRYVNLLNKYNTPVEVPWL